MKTDSKKTLTCVKNILRSGTLRPILKKIEYIELIRMALAPKLAPFESKAVVWSMQKNTLILAATNAAIATHVHFSCSSWLSFLQEEVSLPPGEHALKRIRCVVRPNLSTGSSLEKHTS